MRSALPTRTPYTIALLCLPILGAVAQSSFPKSGSVYLAFDAAGERRSLEVSAGEEFELHVITDVASPSCIAGLEGSFPIPPGLELQEVNWLSPAVDLGGSFSSAEERTFLVGLGVCRNSGGGKSFGHAVLKVTGPIEETTLHIDAPGVGASSISSFAGEGPGWVDGTGKLFLFSTPRAETAAVLQQSVATDRSSFSRVKALYR